MYLYWIYNPTTKYSKIGVTRSYDTRANQIENGTGCEILPLWILEMKSDCAFSLEAFLHTKLDPFRQRGEWFELPVGVAGYLYNLFSLFIKTFSHLHDGKTHEVDLFCTNWYRYERNFLEAYDFHDLLMAPAAVSN